MDRFLAILLTINIESEVMKRRTFNHLGLATAITAVTGTAVAAGNHTSTPRMQIRPAAERGQAEHGWLSSRHSFSFASYRDPAHLGFSDLLVINEDKVAPGRGFGTHPHRDVEIFSYVLEGALEHKDSMGSGAVCQPGDVQFMSAGRGVAHSEFNPSRSDPVHFLQIWLAPANAGGEPAYRQQHFSAAEKSGKLRLILSQDAAEGSIRIGQDVRVYAGLFSGRQQAKLPLGADRRAYVHVARGEIEVNGMRLVAGDGLKVLTPGTLLQLQRGLNAEVLVFDLRADGAVPV